MAIIFIIFPWRFCSESNLWEINYKFDFTTIEKDHLKKHIQSVHREVTYSCDECNYTTTEIGYLRNHIKSTHSKAQYPCDKCDYTAIHQDNLKTNKKSKHPGKENENEPTIIEFIKNEVKKWNERKTFRKTWQYYTN